MSLNKLRALVALIDEIDNKLQGLPSEEYEKAQESFEPFEFFIRTLLAEREAEIVGGSR